MNPSCFIPFQSTPAGPLPERFTFPFLYTPHPLSMLAAAELRAYLEGEPDWQHAFWMQEDQDGEAYGKMFGVLVVRTEQGELGYLAAFSGKLGGKNHYPGFVPPVFDLLDEEGFYRRGEEELNQMNRRIEQLEQDPTLATLEEQLLKARKEAAAALDAEKLRAKTAKALRDERRGGMNGLDESARQALEEELMQESRFDHFRMKDLKRHWKEQTDALEQTLEARLAEIRGLKEARREKSAALQQHIFDHYYFLNQAGERKSLADIFQRNAATPPPAGAGECAAPKLLQYAFLHGLKPVAMAEFWWGTGGGTETGAVRKHGHFYPACRGKCEPILAHMLEGIPLEPNPMQQDAPPQEDPDIVYEDEYLAVVYKPAAMLSVPGKQQTDSVLLRMKRRYPEATGPLLVHRLDMGTSGLLLVAKTAEVHKQLQSQFMGRSIKKRYVALLEGELANDSGVIDLPLRVDLDDRPRQMVCYTYGKSARTEWEVVARGEGLTRVYFYPITGRTHQLRVHAAHPAGLNAPILGDELYGTKGKRLHLHAERLEFRHPVSGEWVVVERGAEF
ncbi:MAG TPA: pseudouridine synthase [Saprospiraceae bacterium]|nr:pseudouridine synthase [Saprospiraceae bacterium]